MERFALQIEEAPEFIEVAFLRYALQLSSDPTFVASEWLERVEGSIAIDNFNLAIQSRLNDPLSRFSRHELEFLYDRWEKIRDAHLQKLLLEAKTISGLAAPLIAKAPRSAQDAARRLVGQR